MKNSLSFFSSLSSGRASWLPGVSWRILIFRLNFAGALISSCIRIRPTKNSNQTFYLSILKHLFSLFCCRKVTGQSQGGFSRARACCNDTWTPILFTASPCCTTHNLASCIFLYFVSKTIKGKHTPVLYSLRTHPNIL